jgi:hypothetical protein
MISRTGYQRAMKGPRMPLQGLAILLVEDEPLIAMDHIETLERAAVNVQALRICFEKMLGSL